MSMNATVSTSVTITQTVSILLAVLHVRVWMDIVAMEHNVQVTKQISVTPSDTIFIPGF